jgi:large subunit ribosomal protein L21
MADTYAIVETGGKQYRAEKGGTLVVERLRADEGDKVSLRPVMYSGGKDVVAAGDDLEKVQVEAVVAEHLRGEKIRIFTYRAKKGSSRRAGHRQALTRLEVTDVKMLSRRPAAKPAANSEAKPAAPAKKPAAKKTAARKPAAKKTTAAKKPARKPATRKTSSTRTKKES